MKNIKFGFQKDENGLFPLLFICHADLKIHPNENHFFKRFCDIFLRMKDMYKQY